MKHLLRFVAFSAAAFLAVASHATDVSITAANLLPSSQALYANGIAGEAITGGQIVCESMSDGRYYLADANVTTKLKVAGIAGHGAAAGQPLAIIYWDPALTLGGTLSMSAPVYVLSATAGGVAPSADLAAGHYPIVLGVAISTTKIFFAPRLIQGTGVVVAP